MMFLFIKKASGLQVDFSIHGGFISGFVLWQIRAENSGPDAKRDWQQWGGGFVQVPATPTM